MVENPENPAVVELPKIDFVVEGEDVDVDVDEAAGAGAFSVSNGFGLSSTFVRAFFGGRSSLLSPLSPSPPVFFSLVLSITCTVPSTELEDGADSSRALFLLDLEFDVGASTLAHPLVKPTPMSWSPVSFMFNDAVSSLMLLILVSYVSLRSPPQRNVTA